MPSLPSTHACVPALGCSTHSGFKHGTAREFPNDRIGTRSEPVNPLDPSCKALLKRYGKQTSSPTNVYISMIFKHLEPHTHTLYFIAVSTIPHRMMSGITTCSLGRIYKYLHVLRPSLVIVPPKTRPDPAHSAVFLW